MIHPSAFDVVWRDDARQGDAGWMQPFTLLNPISHFSTIARGVLLKGAGIEAIWPHMLALVGFAVALVGVSAWRFRKQLG
jgi:drug efflux transport system permease protein